MSRGELVEVLTPAPADFLSSQDGQVAPEAGSEAVLAEVLAELMGVERVSVDGHFFDDVGANSLMMTHFCARVRKRPDLPSGSIKDIYRDPTIKSLVAALPAVAPAPPVESDTDSPKAPSTGESGSLEPVKSSVSTAGYVLCGTLLLVILGFTYLGGNIISWGWRWISAGPVLDHVFLGSFAVVGVSFDSAALLNIYLRSLAFVAAGFLAFTIVPILLKAGGPPTRKTPVRGLPFVVAEASGSFVRDVDGNVFIDFRVGGASPLGHTHPGLATGALQRAGSGPAGSSGAAAARCAFTAVELSTLPEPMRDRMRLWYCAHPGVGALSAALDLCCDATGRRDVVSFPSGLYVKAMDTVDDGEAAGELSTRQAAPKPRLLPYSPCGHCAARMDAASCRSGCTSCLERALDQGAASLPAAVLISMVPGEGGFIPASRKFVKRARALTRELGIPLVVDEMATGSGRTGTWFSFEQYDIEPDVIIASNAVGIGPPIGLVLHDVALRAKGAQPAADAVPGNRLAFLAGTQLVRVVRRDELLKNARARGEQLSNRLAGLHHHPAVLDAQGSGLVWGVELIAPDDGRSAAQLAAHVQARALGEGLILGLGGATNSVLRILPPLTVSAKVVDVASSILLHAIEGAFLASESSHPFRYHPTTSPPVSLTGADNRVVPVSPGAGRDEPRGGDQRQSGNESPALTGIDSQTALAHGGDTATAPDSEQPLTDMVEQQAQAQVPDGLAAAVRRLAEQLGVPFSAVPLAAHAKVMSAVSGEREVATGYVTAQGGVPPIPCQLSTAAGSWRELVLNTHQTESELLSNTDRHTGGEPSCEIVFDLSGGCGDLAGSVVLWVGISERGGRLTLRVRCRPLAFGGEAAGRLVGYYLTALALMVADPESGHGRDSLVSVEECQFQLEELAGSVRQLPDFRFHELFERRVAADPDAIAAIHGDRRWTYQELNSRANRLGRTLLAQGLGSEDVVAVVTERNLEWMAAVLAVFKAGGVYLPIEPHFPSDRITATLTRAECGLVLTQPGASTNLDQALTALSGIRSLYIEDAYEREHAQGDHGEDNLGVVVGPDQLAYIYFTSGSTGEPKGAMCEHAGMLNHLYAKIDDCGIVEGQVVAQTAPQCFDISLWQLVSALLVGGRTLIVEQEVILDIVRFLDAVVAGRVAVLQIVPSYLEVVVSYLEGHPRELVDLRCVSVTGEALKKNLTVRWFGVRPGIKLVNAYGLTETSDDTNHEVLECVPDSEGVPLGRPVNNVRVYVVDEHLHPVPLGAPGEIVFSGVCVGRGYINDPERTRLAFMADPHRIGQRLYRSGDYGRWGPGGTLEFLGRRDTQVKISGFRIEIGEIENTLLGIPGVRDGAVVVAQRTDQSKYLVVFYSGPEMLPVELLRDRLGQALPIYMVPSAFHWRQALPLTANGKIDRKTLTTLAGELEVPGYDYQAPTTATEQRLAAAWARVLNVAAEQIGRHDHFFDRGGTSLSAVKLAIILDRVVSLKDLTRHPVLADLAGLVDGRSPRRRELLQLLSRPEEAPAGVLVCFPYAGGNAMNFASMARVLRGGALSVYAVELPGHDLAGLSEPFAPLPQIVEQVVTEITAGTARDGRTPVVLWGHSSGSAFAVETARKLTERGVKVARVFLGAQLLGRGSDEDAAIAGLEGQSEAEIFEMLRASNENSNLDELDAQHAAHVAAAYRHDCLSAHRYFAEALQTPPTVKLSAPLTVVVAADDLRSAQCRHRYQDWALFADTVELHELTEGGHYFLRTHASEAAQMILRLAAPSTSATALTSSSDAPVEPQDSQVALTTSALMTLRAAALNSARFDVDLQPGRPAILCLDGVSDAASWADEHFGALRAIATEHGAILIRGLQLGDPAQVAAVYARLSGALMTDKESFAPRRSYSPGVYSSSKWPTNQTMCMHHELSYTLEFPGLMLFACLRAPTEGGATSVTDSSAVLDALSQTLVKRFERDGWLLTSNYNDDIGTSLVEEFGTQDRDAIEDYCRANEIAFEWQPDGGLRTRQRRSSVVTHPITGQRCWFNQIAFLNEWTLAPEIREYLVEIYGSDSLPFNTRFGNGDPIDEDIVTLLNQTYETHIVREPWQHGDLMLVDNIRAAHSRERFQGEREVLVAMADPVHLTTCSPTVQVHLG